MTEMVNGTSQDLNGSVSQPVNSASAPSQAFAEERLFKQSELDNIIKREKHEAVESYKRKVNEQPQYMQQRQSDVVPQNNAHISSDEIKKIAAEEIRNLERKYQEEAQKQEAQVFAQEFYSKLTSGKDRYSDFDQVTNGLNYARFPLAVQLANRYIDNTVDVIYMLGKDRMKMAALEMLAQNSPEDAINEIQKLSKSIKENEQVSKVRLPNEPLSQMRPSNTGTDKGVLSVSEYRRMKHFKV